MGKTIAALRERRASIAEWLNYDVTCIRRNGHDGLYFAAANDRAAYRELARIGWRYVRGEGWLCPTHAKRKRRGRVTP